MSDQSPVKKWLIAGTTIVLLVGLMACSPFGKKAPTPTQPPPPTETPLPVLPTYTPTPTVVPPTATPTAAAEEEKQPTLTPTPVPAARQEGKAQEPAVIPVTYKVTRAPYMGDVIKNGSFEEGFDDNGVAKGWTAFDNGKAAYAWEDDLMPEHVSHGSHAQLMRIMGPEESDRFVGIYQTVDVIPGETYTLTLHGIIRSSTAGHSETPYGHRMQWAVDYSHPTDWNAVNNDWSKWTDTGWNDVPLDAKNPPMNVYVQQIVPKGDRLTLYIRGWSKWPIIHSEAKFYIDGITLQGPVPGEEIVVTAVVARASAGEGEGMPTTGGRAAWIPVLGVVLVLGFAFWEIRRAKA